MLRRHEKVSRPDVKAKIRERAKSPQYTKQVDVFMNLCQGMRDKPENKAKIRI